jgi:hypothetical protein
VNSCEGRRCALGSSPHEDAEWMAGRVGIDSDRLHRVVVQIPKQCSSQTHCTRMLFVELRDSVDAEVQVQHLGVFAVRPRCGRKCVDLLKRDSPRTVGCGDREPIRIDRFGVAGELFESE